MILCPLSIWLIWLVRSGNAEQLCKYDIHTPHTQEVSAYIQKTTESNFPLRDCLRCLGAWCHVKSQEARSYGGKLGPEAVSSIDQYTHRQSSQMRPEQSGHTQALAPIQTSFTFASRVRRVSLGVMLTVDRLVKADVTLGTRQL